MTILLFIIFFLGGVLLYYGDLQIIKKLKKTKGLIVGRSIVWRVVLASLLIILLEFKIPHGSGGFQEEIAYGLLEWIALIVGFYCAVPFLKVVPRKFKVLIEYAQKAEAGKVNPVEDFKEKFSETGSKFKEKGMQMAAETIVTSATSKKDEALPHSNINESAHEKVASDKTASVPEPGSAESLQESLKKYKREG